MLFDNAENPPQLPIAFYTDRKAMTREAITKIPDFLLWVFIGLVLVLHKNSPPYKSPLALVIFFSVLYFGFIFYFVYEFVTKPVVFYIDEAGFTLKGGTLFIPWHDIDSIQKGTSRSRSGLIKYYLAIISLKNEKHFPLSFWQRVLYLPLKVTKNQPNRPLVVNLMRTNIRADTIITWLNYYKNKYGSAR